MVCSPLFFHEPFQSLIDGTVAVTRAQALLIVVGDPAVLSLDPLWRSFLNYIYLNGGWTGSPPNWDPRAPVDENGGYDIAIQESARQGMNDLMERLQAATLTSAGGLDP
jgi:helicase MOV-10